MTGVLIRRGNLDAEAQGKEASRGPGERPQGEPAPTSLDLGLPAPRNREARNFRHFSLLACGELLSIRTSSESGVQRGLVARPVGSSPARLGGAGEDAPEAPPPQGGPGRAPAAREASSP